MSNPPRQRPGGNSEVGKRRLAANVEDLQLGGRADDPEPAARPAVAPLAAGPTPDSDGVKVPLSTRVPLTTVNAARAAVMATAGHPDGCRSLSDLIAQAIAEKVANLERQLNDGRPFTAVDHFRTGRPLGS